MSHKSRSIAREVFEDPKTTKKSMNVCQEIRCFRVIAILMLKFEIAVLQIFCQN